MLLLDDGGIVPGAWSETVLAQKVMQLSQCRNRQTRRAEPHRDAGDGIQNPRRGDDDHPRRRLQMDNPPGITVLAALAANALPEKGVPAIVNLDLLPDMGRMTG